MFIHPSVIIVISVRQYTLFIAGKSRKRKTFASDWCPVTGESDLKRNFQV